LEVQDIIPDLIGREGISWEVSGFREKDFPTYTLPPETNLTPTATAE